MKFPVMPVFAVALFVVGFMTGRWSAPSSAAPAPAPTAMPTAPAPSRPMQPAPSAPSGALTGVIAEVQQVPNYTYLRLSTTEGEVWAAITSNSSLSVGQQVNVIESTRMTDFTSKSLGKTFPSIVFGELAQGGAAAPPTQGSAMPPGHPTTSGAAAVPPIAKVLDSAKQNEPALSLRVMDVFAERQALEGHLVKVHGTVKRVTEVQGMHYAHLVDGSGSAASKDDDLVVLTSTALQPEQTVTLQGRVVLNKDVGIGAWPVALEGATSVQ